MNTEKRRNFKNALQIGITCIGAYLVSYYMRNLLSVTSPEMLKTNLFTTKGCITMKIAIAGTGYVGLVTGVCLAEVGNKALCVDVDESKIEKMEAGISPIYEADLEINIASDGTVKVNAENFVFKRPFVPVPEKK